MQRPLVKKAAFAHKLKSYMAYNRGIDWMPKTAADRAEVTKRILSKYINK